VKKRIILFILKINSEREKKKRYEKEKIHSSSKVLLIEFPGGANKKPKPIKIHNKENKM